MQFINIVVHSVENMNFRVHLQYEFTHLGLDKYLEVSMHKNLSVKGVNHSVEPTERYHPNLQLLSALLAFLRV